MALPWEISASHCRLPYLIQLPRRGDLQREWGKGGSGKRGDRTMKGIGHNLRQEAPRVFAGAVVDADDSRSAPARVGRAT